MSLGALLLHNWRLRRIRLAMQAATRRMLAYEAAYGHLPFTREHSAGD